MKLRREDQYDELGRLDIPFERRIVLGIEHWVKKCFTVSASHLHRGIFPLDEE